MLLMSSFVRSPAPFSFQRTVHKHSWGLDALGILHADPEWSEVQIL